MVAGTDSMVYARQLIKSSQSHKVTLPIDHFHSNWQQSIVVLVYQLEGDSLMWDYIHVQL